MSVALISGSAGLIGAEAARHFAGLGLDVVGIDNDLRRYFFGADGLDRGQPAARPTSARRTRTSTSTSATARDWPTSSSGTAGTSRGDPRRRPAQPRLGRQGAVHRLRGQRRRHPEHAGEHPPARPDAPFIHCSTNKVYGDLPNEIPLVELDTRYEIEPGHQYELGITEEMPIDHSLHSVFGASKVAADVMVQEYGRYFGLKTACSAAAPSPARPTRRPSCTASSAYLMRCVMEGRTTGSTATRERWSATPSTPTTCSPRSRRSSAPPARARSTTSAAGGTPTPRTSRVPAGRGDLRPRSQDRVRGADPDRRPPVVRQQHGPLPGALPRVAAALRRAGDPARDPRRQRRVVGAGAMNMNTPSSACSWTRQTTTTRPTGSSPPPATTSPSR